MVIHLSPTDFVGNRGAYKQEIYHYISKISKNSAIFFLMLLYKQEF